MALLEEWDQLLAQYHRTIRAVEGTGNRGQYYIDKEMAKLTQFCLIHPEFAPLKPKKHQNDNDHWQGTTKGMAHLANLF